MLSRGRLKFVDGKRGALAMITMQASMQMLI
jgi:hypothetical protein